MQYKTKFTVDGKTLSCNCAEEGKMESDTLVSTIGSNKMAQRRNMEKGVTTTFVWFPLLISL